MSIEVYKSEDQATCAKVAKIQLFINHQHDWETIGILECEVKKLKSLRERMDARLLQAKGKVGAGMIWMHKGCAVNHVKKYKEGSAILLHVCNNKGVMGSGIARRIKDVHPKAFLAYSQVQMVLGKVPISVHTPYIANMISQDGYYGYNGNYTKKVYLSYEALQTCLDKVREFVVKSQKIDRIVIPRFMGSDRAGGDWDTVLSMVLKTFDGIDDIDLVICHIEDIKSLTDYEKLLGF